jgi:glycosyltransferase involved in cell wall biosynthesis
MSRLNAMALSPQLRRIVRGLAPQNPRVIQWIYRPEQSWVRHAVPEGKLVYECYDEYSCTPDGKPLQGVWKNETQLLQTADLTFVTTTSLLERRRGLARAIRLLPNGIPDFFLEEPPLLTDPIDEIPRPRVGYVGVIRRPMNMAMLRAVFAERRDWHLVLVGPVQRDSGVTALRDLPNVHLVGPRPFESLPAIIRKLDVGLIPHQINAFSRGLRPLKLCEYLSAGLPVAATRLPELQGLDRFVSLSDETVSSFTSAIESALGRRGARFGREAKEWAQDYTWGRIAERDVLPALRGVFRI